jgi:hypothetical protein
MPFDKFLGTFRAGLGAYCVRSHERPQLSCDHGWCGAHRAAEDALHRLHTVCIGCTGSPRAEFLRADTGRQTIGSPILIRL